MAGADDPAIVLEQFTNDASNLAPEITHLMEEIEAKDRIVRECEVTIKQRDQILQRHIKSAGPVVAHPKEDAYVKAVLQNYDRALTIQDEKQALAEKACTLLARHTKRLDQLIRELASNGGLEIDESLAALLNGTASNSAAGGGGRGHGNGLGAGGSHGGSAANGVAAGTAPPSSTIAHSNLARLVTSNLAGTGSGGRAGSPTSATQARGSREGSTDAKRRRLNLPAQGSNLRQSSTGPGTPKAGTPQPGGGSGAGGAGGAGGGAGSGAGGAGRAGSVPRGSNKKDGKSGGGAGGSGSGAGGGSGSNKLLAPPKGGQVNPDSKAAKSRKKKGGGGGSGGSGNDRASGSRKKGAISDADDSAMSNAGDESGSERLSTTGGHTGTANGNSGTGAHANNSGGNTSGAGGDVNRSKDGAADDDDREDMDMGGMEDDDEGGDTNLYCTCRSVSYGNMVACDSDDCPYEWFHWNCVGLTKEPPGKWYCEECKARLGMK